MLLAILGGIKIVELVVHRFWDKDYLFFDWLKLKYIFDGADLLILAGFLSWGVYSILGAFIRRPSKNE